MNLKIIIRETIEDSEFDWIREVPSFTPGKYFSEEEICFDAYNEDDCSVSIDDEETIFNLDYENWRDKLSEGFGDSNWVIESLLENPNYDGGGDYYDFDSDEFNYAGYQMNPEERERLQKIIDIISPGVNIEEYLNDDLNSLEKHLTNKEIKGYWETLTYTYLDIIGYQVQENRWKSIAEYYRDITTGALNVYKIPVKFEKLGGRWGDSFKITVKTNDLLNILHQKNENDLSRALDILSAIITRPNWYDYFYEEWDTSGAEDKIGEAFNKFLDNTETYIEEESEEFKEQKDFYDNLKKLGFETRGGRSDVWTKDIPDGGIWVVSYIDFNDYKLKLEKKNSKSMWVTTDEKDRFVIDFEDLPTYLNQYRMDI